MYEIYATSAGMCISMWFNKYCNEAIQYPHFEPHPACSHCFEEICRIYIYIHLYIPNCSASQPSGLRYTSNMAHSRVPPGPVRRHAPTTVRILLAEAMAVLVSRLDNMLVLCLYFKSHCSPLSFSLNQVSFHFRITTKSLSHFHHNQLLKLIH